MGHYLYSLYAQRSTIVLPQYDFPPMDYVKQAIQQRRKNADSLKRQGFCTILYLYNIMGVCKHVLCIASLFRFHVGQ